MVETTDDAPIRFFKRLWCAPTRGPVPRAVFVAVFFAGVAVGFLGLSVWVVPNIATTGSSGWEAQVSSGCNGWWPQISFNGYFHCEITVGCPSNLSGSYTLSVTAPGASNLALSPSSVGVQCGSPTTFTVSGQLGYSGSVTIYLNP